MKHSLTSIPSLVDDISLSTMHIDGNVKFYLNSINVRDCNITATEDVFNYNSLSVYPILTNGILTLDLTNTGKELVEVMAALGKIESQCCQVNNYLLCSFRRDIQSGTRLTIKRWLYYLNFKCFHHK